MTQAIATAPTPEVREFRTNPRLLLDVIRRQAGSLFKAVLEGVMNAVDAKATKVTITVNDRLLIISDDGTGITERIVLEKFWETFGHPPEEGENKTYGYFRMGRGQLFAFGQNLWQTGPFMMDVDIAKRGLKYDLWTQPEPVPGCHITIMLYETLDPVKIFDLKRDLEMAVKYVSIPVTLNEVVISKDPAQQKWDHVLEEAYINLRESGPLHVYNLGVLVASHHAHKFGCGGDVVSRRQLEVNFARNEIMSTCPIWRRVKPLVDEKAGRLLQKQPALNDAGRQRLADQIVAREHLPNVEKLRIFTDTSGKHWSLEMIRSQYKWTQHMTVGPAGDRLADKIMQRRQALVLSQETLARFHVGSFQKLQKLLVSYDDDRLFAEAIVEDFDELRRELDSSYKLLAPDELRLSEKLVIDTLSGAARGLHYLMYPDVTIRRQLYVGEGPAHGWTDGETYVAINRALIEEHGMDLGAWMQYVCLLIHEFCHTETDQQSHVHGPEFYQTYHDATMQHLTKLVHHCITEFPKIEERYRKKQSRKQAQEAARLRRLQTAQVRATATAQ